MSYAKLRNDLLEARDTRQALLAAHFNRTSGALVQVGLNFPGPNKHPRGSDALLMAILDELYGSGSEFVLLHPEVDALGPWVLLWNAGDATVIKSLAVGIEESRPWGRLADIDVYDQQGHAVSRDSCGLAPRQCLVCLEPAFDCIRLQRHTLTELENKIDELLAPFRT